MPTGRKSALASTQAPTALHLSAGCSSPSPAARCAVSGCRRSLTDLIQQALLQVLTPVFDPHFSDRSYGFRPGRSAHQAVRAAQEAIAPVTAGWSISTWKPSSTG